MLSPQFGSRKRPGEFCRHGSGGCSARRYAADSLGCAIKGFLLDVRDAFELAVEAVPGAMNIPLSELRGRLGELPRDKEINVICRSGQRAFAATRILMQNGFKAKNISGGMLSRTHTFLFNKEMENNDDRRPMTNKDSVGINKKTLVHEKV